MAGNARGPQPTMQVAQAGGYARIEGDDDGDGGGSNDDGGLWHRHAAMRDRDHGWAVPVRMYAQMSEQESAGR
jgi:hypothetical protein